MIIIYSSLCSLAGYLTYSEAQAVWMIRSLSTNLFKLDETNSERVVCKLQRFCKETKCLLCGARQRHRLLFYFFRNFFRNRQMIRNGVVERIKKLNFLFTKRKNNTNKTNEIPRTIAILYSFRLILLLFGTLKVLHKCILFIRHRTNEF